MGMFDPPKPKDNTPREVCDAGMYPARLIWIIDLGTVDEPTYEDPSVTKPKHQLYVGFELSGDKMKDGRPFMVSERYTVTNGRWGPYVSKTSKLRDVLKSWKNWDEKTSSKLGNLGSLIGTEAFLNVLKEEKKKTPGEFYNRIAGVMPLPKGMKVDDQTNPNVVYEIGGPGFDELPDFLKKRIEQSYEYQKKPLPSRGTSGEASAAAGDDHGIPF